MGGRPLTKRTTTSPKLRLSSAPLNLRPDSKVPTRAKHKPPHRLSNAVALSYQTFSLAYILVGYAFGSAICIAYGDCNDGDEDGRNGARSAVRSGGCCIAKKTPPYKTCALRVLQHPLRPAYQFPKKPNRPQSALRAAEAASMVDCQRLKRPEAVWQRKRHPWSIVKD